MRSYNVRLMRDELHENGRKPKRYITPETKTDEPIELEYPGGHACSLPFYI